ncbi:redoxin domain-containing protein [Microbacterium sp.]|uniref:redoxin domain-containing protein n=1 Tax=Microbacterium sp. TaxID=51671 RepID=UPI003A954EC1
MTAPEDRLPLWQRTWVLWASSALLLVVVAGLVAVALGGGGSPTVQPAADALPAGMNQVTSNLLGVEPVASDPVAASPYRLTDQHGTTVDSAQLRGKVVVLTFNDDRCTDLCAMLATDIVAADHDLSAAARAKVAFVSINANPYYPTTADVKAWSDQHGLDALPNWEFLSGSPAQLKAAAAAYDVPVELDPATRTVSHGSQIFIIDPRGRIVEQAAFGTESADTGPFAHGLATLAADALPASQRGTVAGQNLADTIAGGTGIGDTPAPLTGTALAGTGTVGTASTHGRYTVVDFWSSTCAACATQLPDDQAESSLLKGAVAFLGVDVSDQASAARAAAARAKVAFPTLQDPKGVDAARFRVSELPYTVVLSPTGEVLLRHPGLFTTDELDYVLRDLDRDLPPGQG